MSIFSKLFLTFVCCNLPKFAFSSAGHCRLLGLSAVSSSDHIEPIDPVKYRRYNESITREGTEGQEGIT